MNNRGINRVEKNYIENVCIGKLCGVGAAISREFLTAKFNPDIYSRRLHPRIESDIEDIWKVKSARNSRLYDGSKFRLAGWEIREGKLEFHIGLTSYKDLCGTNLNVKCESLREMGENEHTNSQAYMADALGKI